jgi:hypothetical protein
VDEPSLNGEEVIAEIRYIPSLIKLLKIFTDFNPLLSKTKIPAEIKIKKKRENFCLAPLCKRAERMAIPKSSLFVDIL